MNNKNLEPINLYDKTTGEVKFTYPRDDSRKWYPRKPLPQDYENLYLNPLPEMWDLRHIKNMPSFDLMDIAKDNPFKITESN